MGLRAEQNVCADSDETYLSSGAWSSVYSTRHKFRSAPDIDLCGAGLSFHYGPGWSMAADYHRTLDTPDEARLSVLIGFSASQQGPAIATPCRASAGQPKRILPAPWAFFLAARRSV